MTWGPPDQIDRTAKIVLDAGFASDPLEARQLLETLVLQVAVGPEIAYDPAAQAALATIVNTGGRAFLGGVQVKLDADPILATGWTAGIRTSQVVTRYGGRITDQLATDRPTLVLGSATRPTGNLILHLTWQGWSGGVVQRADDVLAGHGNAVAGIAAGALGVSEAFQRQLGSVLPGRRDVGISLWRPDLNWRENAATGPDLQYLPASVWLLGLGHLGQAYAWTLGMLPYANPADVELGLLDFDFVIPANTATQLLVGAADVNKRKTRVVAAALEDRGYRTRIVERAFDQNFHPHAHADPARNEPRFALAGFDDVTPRRHLGEAGFAHITDAGLGSGPKEYLDMVIHAFPALEAPASAFAGDPAKVGQLPEPYEKEIARLQSEGIDEAVARCGMLDVAGVTVGAAFVGTFASTLAIADVLRLLHDGENYSVISIDLRAPSGARAVSNSSPGPYPNPPFTRVRAK
jgi:ThiF family protein